MTSDDLMDNPVYQEGFATGYREGWDSGRGMLGAAILQLVEACRHEPGCPCKPCELLREARPTPADDEDILEFPSSF